MHRICTLPILGTETYCTYQCYSDAPHYQSCQLRENRQRKPSLSPPYINVIYSPLHTGTYEMFETVRAPQTGSQAKGAIFQRTPGFLQQEYTGQG